MPGTEAARPTGCEIDVPSFVWRGGFDAFFRLWLRVDDAEPRQLYRSFRHCVPLTPGRHRITIHYGDSWAGGLAETELELREGEVTRIEYAPPVTAIWEWWAFRGKGRIRASRVRPSFGPEAWARPPRGRFTEGTCVPVYPAIVGGRAVEPEERRRHARFWRAYRRFQHEPGRNHTLCAAAVLPAWGSLLWILRAISVGGDSALAVPLLPIVWFAIAWAISMTPREGPAFRTRKLGATLTLLALAFLLIGGLAEGWGLPSEADRRYQASLEAAMGPNQAAELLDAAQQLAASGDLSGALERLEEARERSPADPEIRIALAHGLLQQGHREDAVTEIVRAFDRRSFGGAARQLARRPALVRAVWKHDAFQALRDLHPEIDEELTSYGFGQEWEFVSDELVL